MAKMLYTVREHQDLTADTWQQFRDRVTAADHSPTDALARLVRRYLARGFDDGAPEARPAPAVRPPCLCGCGGFPKGAGARFLPGHDLRKAYQDQSGRPGTD